MHKKITTVSLIKSIAKANFCSTSGANARKFNAGYGFEGTHPKGKPSESSSLSRKTLELALPVLYVFLFKHDHPEDFCKDFLILYPR